MKVLKVIVDEMPEGCKRCRFAHDRGKLLRENESLTGNSHYCEITRKELYWDDWMNRHPECPLVTVDKAFDWMMYENPATPYIEQAITDWAKGNEPEYFKKAGDK